MEGDGNSTAAAKYNFPLTLALFLIIKIQISYKLNKLDTYGLCLLIG